MSRWLMPLLESMQDTNFASYLDFQSDVVAKRRDFGIRGVSVEEVFEEAARLGWISSEGQGITVKRPVKAEPTSTPSATQPNYYRFDAKGVSLDIIDVIQGLGLGCEAGNVYKYLARAGKKDASKHIEDLEKAREWLDRLIEYRRRS